MFSANHGQITGILARSFSHFYRSLRVFTLSRDSFGFFDFKRLLHVIFQIGFRSVLNDSFQKTVLTMNSLLCRSVSFLSPYHTEGKVLGGNLEQT